MTEPRNYFRFTHVVGDHRVTVRCDGDANLSDLLDQFEAFLKGCGFPLDGSLDFVGESKSTPAADEYAAKNPLGGPATMFETIAMRLRAGEEYGGVMADYGIRFEKEKAVEG